MAVAEFTAGGAAIAAGASDPATTPKRQHQMIDAFLKGLRR
ncbi:hypothetical protein ACPZ19_50395 [Amycolatopsis lurida]